MSRDDTTKTGNAPARRRWPRILSPVERLSEAMFGLIMALSITGSLSVAASGKNEVRTMLIGAIGCNTAWGIIDAMFYLVSLLVERDHGLVLFHGVRKEKDPERAQQMIADCLPPLIATAIRPSELEYLRLQVAEVVTVPTAGLTRRDFLGALGVFMCVFLATLPVVLPFLLPVEPLVALRLSNAVAVAMLFALGYGLGTYVGRRPIVIGAWAVAIGLALVGVTIALGG
jgi:hypothetical protein